MWSCFLPLAGVTTIPQCWLSHGSWYLQAIQLKGSVLLCFQRLLPFPCLFSGALPRMFFPSANAAFPPPRTAWGWERDWMGSGLLTRADRAEWLPRPRGCGLLSETPAPTFQRGPMLPWRAGGLSSSPGHSTHGLGGLASPPGHRTHRPSGLAGPPGHPTHRPSNLAGPQALLRRQPWQVGHGTRVEPCWGSPALWVTAETSRESSPPQMPIWGGRRSGGVLPAREGGSPALLLAGLVVVVVEPSYGAVQPPAGHLPNSASSGPPETRRGWANTLYLSGIALFLPQHGASYTHRKRHISFPRRLARHCPKIFSIHLQVC